MAGTYRTIVVDPPWHYDGFANNVGTRRTVPLPYASMKLTAISALPVSTLADKDCRLWLWTTNRYLSAAFALVEGWGFSYSRTLVWAKPDPPPVSNGHIAWFGVEFLLVAQRGRPEIGGIMPSYIVHPNLRHSQKPDVWLDHIERVSPGPRLEMFARRQRLGWDTWGNEALEHVEMTS